MREARKQHDIERQAKKRRELRESVKAPLDESKIVPL
jgi:hypothetical protein